MSFLQNYYIIHYKTKLSIVAFTLLGTISSITATPVEDWSLLKENDGVILYERKSSEKDVYEFRGVGLIEYDIVKLAATVVQPTLMSEWVYWFESSKLIERNYTTRSYDEDLNNFYQIIYGETYFLPPYNNRDWVIKGTLNFTEQGRDQPPIITLFATSIVHPLAPQKENLVRMDLLEVTFILTPQGTNNQHTLLDFQFYFNPAGHFPNWIVNLTGDHMVSTAFDNLRKLYDDNDTQPEMEPMFRRQMNRLYPKLFE
ncbi:MAG: START domain-containing protein [Fibrobacterales bacterium]